MSDPCNRTGQLIEGDDSRQAVQLAARFEMTIDPATAELCRTIDLSDLPHERIWGEVEKWLTLARRPTQFHLGIDLPAQ